MRRLLSLKKPRQLESWRGLKFGSTIRRTTCRCRQSTCRRDARGLQARAAPAAARLSACAPGVSGINYKSRDGLKLAKRFRSKKVFSEATSGHELLETKAGALGVKVTTDQVLHDCNDTQITAAED
jgi:hypothetical protein